MSAQRSLFTLTRHDRCPKMTLAQEYTLVERVPSPDEHYTLRKEAGLTPPPRPENETSLRNTWYCIVVEHKGQTVGMGRMIGDGAIFFTVVDMCILPAHQRKGLGNAILSRLLEYADKNAPNARISLCADAPGVGLYKKFGFGDTGEKLMTRSTYFKVRPFD